MTFTRPFTPNPSANNLPKPTRFPLVPITQTPLKVPFPQKQAVSTPTPIEINPSIQITCRIIHMLLQNQPKRRMIIFHKPQNKSILTFRPNEKKWPISMKNLQKSMQTPAKSEISSCPTQTYKKQKGSNTDSSKTSTSNNKSEPIFVSAASEKPHHA